MNKNCLFLITGFLLIFSTHLRGFEKVEISQLVSSVGVSVDNSALLIRCLEDKRCWVSGEDLISVPHQPCSTAKIPHTLIALEVGYAKDPHKVFKWDGQKRFLDVWNKDHTLESAFKQSTLWVYQKITSDLGCEEMSSWIGKLNYGNRFIGGDGDITTYWLDGPLAIS
ncbi:MAG: penicillin-binding transpeptidase domain-containing protein, partial [Chlamydiota bacterium]